MKNLNNTNKYAIKNIFVKEILKFMQIYSYK